MLKIAYAPIYKYELPKGHRFPMIKYELLPQQLLYEGTVKNDNFFTPQGLSIDQFLLTHTPEFLQKLTQVQLSKKEVRKIGFPLTPALVERGRHIAHGTFECALYALQYGISMNIAGGTHHSFPDRGEGFCVFNDFAIASNILLAQKLVSKIMFVDLDVHQGNGNAFIFKDEPRVFTFSMHGENNYPLKKEKSNLDIELADRTDDNTYLNMLTSALPRIIETFEPEIIFYQAGVDILENDKLGRLNVSLKGCLERDRFVLEQARINEIPLVVAMGGGYSEKLNDLIQAHANTYRLAQEIYF